MEEHNVCDHWYSQRLTRNSSLPDTELMLVGFSALQDNQVFSHCTIKTQDTNSIFSFLTTTHVQYKTKPKLKTKRVFKPTNKIKSWIQFTFKIKWKTKIFQKKAEEGYPKFKMAPMVAISLLLNMSSLQ